ncbi:MAG: hypothetical protein ACI87E_002888 [Mariniblastus sp.]|jgi:hypothetical protein
MQSCLSIVALGLMLFITYELLLRGGKMATWLTFLILPICLTPFWIANREFGMFAWAKLYTMLTTACWLTSIRFMKSNHPKWAETGLLVLFGVNILEAVAVDASHGQMATNFNAISGVVGIVLVALLAGSPNIIGRTGKFSALNIFGISRLMIIAYTLWNLTFLYVNFPTIFGRHIAVLGVPLIIGMYKPEAWAQSRIYLLALDLIVVATFRPELVTTSNTASWSLEQWEVLPAGGTLIVCLMCVLARKNAGSPCQQQATFSPSGQCFAKPQTNGV